MIRERMTSGKKAKKAKGGHIGGKTPYGYRVVGRGREAVLEPVEQEQKVIGEVRELLRDRPYLSVTFTARHLAERGLTSRTGKPFFKMQVARIIQQVQQHAAAS